MQTSVVVTMGGAPGIEWGATLNPHSAQDSPALERTVHGAEEKSCAYTSSTNFQIYCEVACK